ncbi:MAG: hypothetical protein DRP66_09790 [Planctomycetota bacterium]|nr:MAG: hypothetical protein DRP66_09790 [Planctomycetota bacterium]
MLDNRRGRPSCGFFAGCAGRKTAFFSKNQGSRVLLNRPAATCVAFYRTNVELTGGGKGTAG